MRRVKGAAAESVYLTPNPAALAAAASQAKNTSAYDALGVPSLAAGSSYNDPVSGLRIWKASSATVPVANANVQHVYSEGPCHISHEWAVGWHTLVIGTASDGYLVDHQRGVGFSNYRAFPVGVGQLTFSQNTATPRICYVQTATQVRRYDTATMSYADTGYFPATMYGGGWLQNDANDEYIVTSDLGAKKASCFRVSTGTTNSYTSPTVYDEPYLARDGRYVLINSGDGAQTQVLWDAQNNTTGTITSPLSNGFGHVGILRGFYTITDGDTGGGIIPIYRVASDGSGNTLIKNTSGYYSDSHMSGKWLQTAGTSQYFLRTVYNWTMAFSGGTETAPESLGLIRIDGGDHRFVAHHYSVKPAGGGDFSYYSQPRSIISLSGKLAMFTSNMNNQTRTDVFVVELPEA
jgi:hypothetical protein